MLMQQGLKPEAGEVNQSSCKITCAVPDDMGFEISRRVKIRRKKDPAFSRNDFFRAMILEHFQRHPVKDGSQ